MSYEKRYNTIDLLPDVAVGIKLPMLRSDGVLFELSYSTEDQIISNLINGIKGSDSSKYMDIGNFNSSNSYMLL